MAKKTCSGMQVTFRCWPPQPTGIPPDEESAESEVGQCPEKQAMQVPIDRTLSCDAPPDHAPEKATATPLGPTGPARSDVLSLLCDFCQQTRNRRGVHEKLLRCKDCSAKAHPSCMNYSSQLAARARMTAWQCIDCKTCCICSDAGDADAMLFCDACDKGYHMTCHDPRVEEKPLGKWVCHGCVTDGCDVEDGNANNVVDSTVRSVDLENGCQSRNKISPDKDSSITCPSHAALKKSKDVPYPDASSWTVEDVVNFFTEKGFSDQASSFEQQEIDGQSLLLLKRSDVLQGLSLKLGPALKIYSHVVKLQTAREPAS